MPNVTIKRISLEQESWPLKIVKEFHIFQIIGFTNRQNEKHKILNSKIKTEL